MALAFVESKLPMAYDQDGVIRIGQTRVTLDTVINAYESGLTAEEIASQYPVLKVADVYQVIGYYLHHKKDVNAYLEKRQSEHEAALQEIKSHYDQSGLRKQLLSRMYKP